MGEILQSLLDSYGLAVLFVAVMVENAGVPVPGETALLAAAFFAHEGHFPLLAVMGVAAAGAILGDNLGYWIGRKAGRAFVLRWGGWFFLTPARVEKLERFFERHGNKTILLARFITGLRVFAALFAGVSRMRWSVFFPYNAAGAVLWVLVIGFLGYAFGASLPLLEQWLGRVGLYVAGAAVLFFLLWGPLRLLRRPRSASELPPKAPLR